MVAAEQSRFGLCSDWSGSIVRARLGPGTERPGRRGRRQWSRSAWWRLETGGSNGGGTTPRYPHLAPALQRLRGGYRRFWGDRTARQRALDAILDAYQRGDAGRLASAVKRVDDAIVAGLEALGLPRGPIAGIAVEQIGRGWLGQKEPGCLLRFDADVLATALRVQHLADDVVRTWVHESIHGRQPFAVDDYAAHQRTRGYEESVAEGLARVVTREKAALEILEVSYDYYVRACQALATVAGFGVEDLWRALWQEPAGRVRDVFVDTVDGLVEQSSGRQLTEGQRANLRGAADRVFASDRANATIGDASVLRQLWEIALR